MNDDVKKLMKEFIQFMEEKEGSEESMYDEMYDDGCEMQLDTYPGDMCGLDIIMKRTYSKRDFIEAIFSIGESMYKPSSGFYDEEYLDSLFESVSEKLSEALNVPYFAVRKQKHQIAIAAPIYIPDATTEIGKALGIIPDMFIEISGPMSTVLVIDCEKEWLRKEYLKIGEDEWLL